MSAHRSRRATTTPGRTTRRSLIGIDATFRYRPLRRAIYRRFVARTEVMWSRREQEDGLVPAFGMYVSGDYQFARRWFGGVRYDRSARASDGSLVDKGPSLVLTFWPSEFSQIRGQYRRTRYAEGVVANEAAVPVPVLDRRARRARVLVDGLQAGSRTRLRPDEARLMKMFIQAAAVIVAALAGADASAAVKVITTTQDLAAIVAEVGGDKVTVESIAKGYQDPHFVEAKPSFIIKLHSADLLVVVGRELEVGGCRRSSPRAGTRRSSRAARATSTPR